MIPKKNIFVDVIENNQGFAVFHCLADHGLKAGDKVRIEEIEGRGAYTTSSALVIEADAHIFITDQQYDGSAHGVYQKNENNTQKLVVVGAMAAIIYFLVKKYKKQM